MKTLLVAALLTALSPSAFSYDLLVDGNTVYNNRCASCHGSNGVATLPTAPNLAGQRKEYVYLQLKDFKSGTRKGTMMGAMVADLSDADFLAVSEYIGATVTCRP